MNKLILFFIFIFTFLFQTKAQETVGSIKGSVIEASSGEPLEFVSVVLQRLPDSIFVKSVNTRKQGQFILSDIPEGTYRLQINFIGFQDKFTSSFTISKSNRVLFFDSINISAKLNVLGEVEISAERDLYETSIDRKIYNVARDIQSISGSASDVLHNVPSVSVDIDGVVSLRGSTNISIFINGKPSPLMKVSSAAALQAIPAGSIERIEIITNPSAKYRPDGAAGIINIVLKKNTRSGFNGTLTCNAGNDDRYNAGLNLNYRVGKINFSSVYGIRKDYRNRTFHDLRKQLDAAGNPANTYEQQTQTSYRPLSHHAETGLTYTFNKHNELGITASAFYMDFKRNEQSFIKSSDENSIINGDILRTRIDPEFEYERELSMSFTHSFKKPDHSINLELLMADQFEQEDNQFTEIYRIPVLVPWLNHTRIKQGLNLIQLTAEYTFPISEDAEFEAGYMGERINQDLNFFGENYLNAQNIWLADQQKSSHFLFKQEVHALYATYSQEIDDFSILTGLRADHTNLISNLLTLDSIIPQNYNKLYPTVHISYEIKKNKQIQLSYSKRINRPEGDELNPFPEYTNPRSIDAGNPQIKPEQFHAVELGYQQKQDKYTFLPTLYYRYTYDAFTEISRFINDTVLLTTFTNLSNSTAAGLELVLTGKVKKFLNFNLNGNVFYNRIDAANLGYSINKSAWLWTAKLAASFILTKSTIMQINTSYRAAQLTPQGKTFPVFVLNAGLKKEVFKKKGAITLTISDVFNTLRWQREINTPEIYEKSNGKRKSQIIYLGFTWRFGYTPKPLDEELKFDEKN
ncbi:MAG: TonB-dependent receptor [Bacteroidota bacterium]|nr:TonB-dependent receptor [Bacteroidota bacterium]